MYTQGSGRGSLGLFLRLVCASANRTECDSVSKRSPLKVSNPILAYPVAVSLKSVTTLRERKTHKQNWGIVPGDCPGTGWVAKICLCVFLGSFLWWRRKTTIYTEQMDAAVLGDRLLEATQKPFLGSSSLSLQCQH